MILCTSILPAKISQKYNFAIFLRSNCKIYFILYIITKCWSLQPEMIESLSVKKYWSTILRFYLYDKSDDTRCTYFTCNLLVTSRTHVRTS